MVMRLTKMHLYADGFYFTLKVEAFIFCKVV